MKKIILVQPENGLNEANYAPLGLMSLASYIRGDFDVQIIDLRFNLAEELIDLVQKTKPMAIGFSMLTGSCILQIIKISQKIKQINQNIKIIAGGIHPTFFPEQTLEHPLMDFVVINEGEKTLKSLLNALEHNLPLDNIDNLGWKKDGQPVINKITHDFINMDELPMPAWDLIPVDRYIKALSHNPGERMINFYTSKGCPFPCGFCYNLYFNKQKWRAKSAEKAFEELKFLYKKYGVNYFIIHDDNFVVDRKRALEFARLIKVSGLKIKYSIDARVDYFNFDFLKTLKESGLAELRVGCESGSNRILREVIQKGITAEQTIKAIEVAKSLGLKLMLSFVIGWPTETVAERQETIDLILKLQKIYNKAAIYPLWIYIPYPGTNLFKKAIDLGFKSPQSLEEWGSYFWGKAHLPWLENRKEYEIIHELSPFAWYSKKLRALPNKSLKNIIRHLLIKLFRVLIVFRFRNNFWRWPVEAWLIAWLKKVFQLSTKKYEKFLAGVNSPSKLKSTHV
jgi:anaerobic magnesium-protoporphyrin IX monomethyl ester cyclase